MITLFFNYSIDCETPANTEYTGPERRPFFHGPTTWESADASVRGFLERMEQLNVARGASLFVYPDVARHQNALYREFADRGVEVALHLNGLRYSRLRGDHAKWMGEMSRDEQREALRMGKADVENVTGKPCVGYRACYGSSNDDTLPLLAELGFEWVSNPGGKHRPEFFACWSGSWRYPHHASHKCRLIPGEMDLYKIPVTSGLKTFFEGNPDQPLDLRTETPPSVVGDRRELLRDVIDENIIEMERRGSPVRAIIGGSHNTNPYADRASHQSQNLEWVVRHARELAAEHELKFVPAPFHQIREEARRIDAY